MTWRLIRWAVTVVVIALAMPVPQAEAQYAIRGGPIAPQRGPSLYVGAYAPSFYPGPLAPQYVGTGAGLIPNYAAQYTPYRPITVVGVAPMAQVPSPFSYSEMYIPPVARPAPPEPPPPSTTPETPRSLSPTEPSAPVPQPKPAANGVAHFTVKLAADAKLWVNDVETKPSGASRRFHTPTNLEPGKSYEYTFRAQWTDNAQTVTRDRTVRFKAGDDVTVDFTQATGQ